MEAEMGRLVFSMLQGDEIVIGHPEIGRIKVTKFLSHKKVQICMDFPKSIRIDRLKVRDNIETEGLRE